MTFHLRRLGNIVNAKKVRRLMSEVHLLNHRYNEHRPVKRVVAASVVVKAPNMVWELDIKYVHVQGEGRNVFLLCFEDCYTREIVNLFGITAPAVMSVQPLQRRSMKGESLR
jgi:putative transposase